MTTAEERNDEPQRADAVGIRLDRDVRPLPTSAEDEAVVLARLAKTPAEAYERGYMDGHAKGAAAARERCAAPAPDVWLVTVPDVWLVKVRRLVEGFEHVSGLARLWEPDYSSGSERALWARATEACADVATLLREAGKA